MKSTVVASVLLGMGLSAMANCTNLWDGCGPNVVAWTNGGALPIPQMTNIPPDLTNAVEVGVGTSHCIALRSDGTVTAWGTNNLGQLNVPADLTNVVRVIAAQNYCVAVRSDGTLTGWGSFPVSILSGVTNVFDISPSSSGGVLALYNDGSVGFVSTNTTLDVMPYPITNAVSISACISGARRLAVLNDGTIKAWGGSGVNPNSATNIPSCCHPAVFVQTGSLKSVVYMTCSNAMVWNQSTTNAPSVYGSDTNAGPNYIQATGQPIALGDDGIAYNIGSTAVPPASVRALNLVANGGGTVSLGIYK